MEIDSTPRTMLRHDTHMDTEEQLSDLINILSVVAAQTDDNETVATTSSANNNVVFSRFDVDDDLLSTRSGSLVSNENMTIMSSCIKNRNDVMLSRAIMQMARGDMAGMSLPDFTLISLGREPQTDDFARLQLMSAGDVDRDDIVWHEISAAYTLLSGIHVEFVESTKCNFCTTYICIGTPVVILKHVSTFEATFQHVQLKIGISCIACAKRRGVNVDLAPLMKVAWNFLEERLTVHTKYIVSGMRDILESVSLVPHDTTAVCDECFAPLGKDDDFLVVVARRIDNSETAIFPVCSEKCKNDLRRNLQNATSASIIQPRPNGSFQLDTNLTLIGNKARVNSHLPDVCDVPVGQWHILNDDQFRSIQTDGLNGNNSSNAHRGTIIHRCQSIGCFCKYTHRGKLIKQYQTKQVAQNNELPAHHLLMCIYERLTKVYLYIDILGSDAQARCIVCKNPATQLCVECRAVRVCSDRCRLKANTDHRALCRPYEGAWTALVVV